MLSRLPLRAGVSTALAFLLFHSHGEAQSCPRTFGPGDGDFRPSQTVLYDQIWCQVSRGAGGWAFAWSEGQDVFARLYSLTLVPSGPQFLVNTVYNQGIQDEPAIAFSSSGNFLVAWSERFGYDGSGMSCFARAYDAAGNPIVGEFLVNANTHNSQWRPLIAPTPSGGWVVAWSGDSDGNSYMRILGSSGAYLTGEIPINTYTIDAQVDPAPAVSPNGNICVAFVDFSSHATTGSGIDLYIRTFNSSGAPLQAQEVLVTSFFGDQRNPRVAADGLNRFLVLWEDQLGDGSGYGVFGRVYNSSGAPLAGEFLVNTTTTSHQRAPRAASDSLGRTMIVWHDESAGVGSSRIRGRRYNGQYQPIGNDFVIHESPASGTTMPSIAMGSSGADMVIGYEGPGATGNGKDVYARRYNNTAGPHTYCTGKINGLGCLPAIGYSGGPSATSPNPFLITASNKRNNKFGFLIYGYASSFAPYQGATICVAAPLKRSAVFNSGGSPAGANDCTGTFSWDFNARIQSGSDPNLVSGATIVARWYSRDGNDPAGFASSLSNGLRFVICP